MPRSFLTLSVAAIALAAAGSAAPAARRAVVVDDLRHYPSAEQACRAATRDEVAFRNCMGLDYGAYLISPKGKADGKAKCLQNGGSPDDLTEACLTLFGGEAEEMAYHALRQAREEIQTEARLKRNGWHLAQMGVRPGTGCRYITYAGKLWERCP